MRRHSRHALLEIDTLDHLLGHPSVGESYESFVVECLVDAAGDSAQAYHYRTARGDEAGLVFVRGGKPIAAIEVKRSTAPVVSGGFRRAADDLGAEHRYLVHPADHGDVYESQGVTITDLLSLVKILRSW